MDEELRKQFERIEARIQYHLGRLRRRAREMQMGKRSPGITQTVRAEVAARPGLPGLLFCAHLPGSRRIPLSRSEACIRDTLDQMWDQFRQKYGVYLRLLEAIPADSYTAHPVPGMRTPAELAVHVSGSVVRDIAEGVAKGRITADESLEEKTAGELGNKTALLAFARECFERADAAVKRVSEAELAAMVPTPWGKSWPGYVAFHILHDEFLHHRGQLYAFARCCGAEPPFMWGYADNAPEYRPGDVPATAGA